MDPITAAALALKAKAFAASAGKFMASYWREALIGTLVLSLAVQHSCLASAQHKLKAEKTAHATDLRICKDNDAKAKVAVAEANASVQALGDASKAATAKAQKAVQVQQKTVQRASKVAAGVMAHQTGPDACKAIHALRMEVSK